MHVRYGGCLSNPSELPLVSASREPINTSESGVICTVVILTRKCCDSGQNELILRRRTKGVEKGMKQRLPHIDPTRVNSSGTAFAPEELPLTVRQAATYLGVSLQTVYLWVERKQIPHLRVMGRNIRFLKSDLEPFRATFKQEVGNGKTE